MHEPRDVASNRDTMGTSVSAAFVQVAIKILHGAYDLSCFYLHCLSRVSNKIAYGSHCMLNFPFDGNAANDREG